MMMGDAFGYALRTVTGPSISCAGQSVSATKTRSHAPHFSLHFWEVSALSRALPCHADQKRMRLISYEDFDDMKAFIEEHACSRQVWAR